MRCGLSDEDFPWYGTESTVMTSTRSLIRPQLPQIFLIFVFPNYLETKFPSDPWTNIDPGCGSVPLFKSRNVLSSHKKAIYVTFGAATFSALEEDIEIANCDAAKVDYINFISTLGRFTNWYFMLNRSQQFASFSKKRTIPVM